MIIIYIYIWIHKWHFDLITWCYSTVFCPILAPYRTHNLPGLEARTTPPRSRVTGRFGWGAIIWCSQSWDNHGEIMDIWCNGEIMVIQASNMGNHGYSYGNHGELTWFVFFIYQTRELHQPKWWFLMQDITELSWNMRVNMVNDG